MEGQFAEWLLQALDQPEVDDLGPGDAVDQCRQDARNRDRGTRRQLATGASARRVYFESQQRCMPFIHGYLRHVKS